jgi:glutathione S-transferase
MSSDSKPKVKFHYFCATGRGNHIRLALAAGGVPFEDEFGSYPPTPEDRVKWGKLTNGNTTFAVPILTLDEGTDKQKVYVQSSAVLRKANRMGDLKMTLTDDPDGDQEMYLTDRAIADADDIRKAGYSGMLMMGATKEAADKFAKVALPKHVKNLENQLVSAGGDYFGGSSTLSIADVTLYDAIVFFGTKLVDGAKGVEDPCGPAIKGWIDRVESDPRIKAYLEGEQFEKILMKPNKSAIGY